MKILMLSPHPFYQARGTPINANLVFRALSERGDQADMVTFPEGSERTYANVKIYRFPDPKGSHRFFESIFTTAEMQKFTGVLFAMSKLLLTSRHGCLSFRPSTADFG